MIGYVEQLFKNVLTICILSSFSKIYVDLFTFVGGNVCIYMCALFMPIDTQKPGEGIKHPP